MHCTRMNEIEKGLFETTFKKERLTSNLEEKDIFQLIGPQYHQKMAQHIYMKQKRSKTLVSQVIMPNKSLQNFTDPDILKNRTVSQSVYQRRMLQNSVDLNLSNEDPNSIRLSPKPSKSYLIDTQQNPSIAHINSIYVEPLNKHQDQRFFSSQAKRWPRLEMDNEGRNDSLVLDSEANSPRATNVEQTNSRQWMQSATESVAKKIRSIHQLRNGSVSKEDTKLTSKYLQNYETKLDLQDENLSNSIMKPEKFDFGASFDSSSRALARSAVSSSRRFNIGSNSVQNSKFENFLSFSRRIESKTPKNDPNISLSHSLSKSNIIEKAFNHVSPSAFAKLEQLLVTNTGRKGRLRSSKRPNDEKFILIRSISPSSLANSEIESDLAHSNQESKVSCRPKKSKFEGVLSNGIYLVPKVNPSKVIISTKKISGKRPLSSSHIRSLSKSITKS